MNHGRVDFECVAYGPDLPGFCFWEVSGLCTTEAECDRRMHVERMRVWVQLLAQAAAGEEWVIEFLDGIGGPDDLLGGPGRSTDQEDDEENQAQD